MILKFKDFLLESSKPVTSLTISDKAYLLVNLNGEVRFNVDGILDCINSKKILEYPHLTTGHLTMMNPKYSTGSFLYHSLLSMISHSTEKDGWYNAEWKQKFGKGEDAWIVNQRCDVVFYDEFCFLLAEDLIKFDSYEALTDEDIWRNVGIDIRKDQKEHPELKPLYDAKNKEQLKKAYRKLVLDWHPDRVGDNETIKYVTVAYVKLKKKLKF